MKPTKAMLAALAAMREHGGLRYASGGYWLVPGEEKYWTHATIRRLVDAGLAQYTKRNLWGDPYLVEAKEGRP